MDIGELVEIYQQIRDERLDLKREFEDKERALKADEERIKMAILGFMQKNGVRSVKTAMGTAYQQEDIIPTGSDWQAFYDWVAENHAFDALERRIKKTFVKEYMENHDGDTPPGVSVLRSLTVNIRRT